MHIHACSYAFVHECSALGGQKRPLDLLGLELQAIARYLIWLLGTELWSSLQGQFVLLTTGSSSSSSSSYLEEQFKLTSSMTLKVNTVPTTFC